MLMTTARIWDKEGAARNGFMPVQTYSNAADKGISYFPRLVSASGDNYYVSFPPFIFLFSYYVLKLFGFCVSVTGLHFLNLFVQIIGAWYLCRILQFFLPSGNQLLPFISALCVWVFAATNLEFYFFAEILGLCLFLALTYHCIGYINYTRDNRFFIFIYAFLLAYTEWISLFFFLSLVVIYLFFPSQRPRLKGLIFLCGTAISAGILLMLVQFSGINGWYALAKSLALRLTMRTGYFSERLSEVGVQIYSLQTLYFLIRNTWKSLYLFPLVFAGMVIAARVFSPGAVKNYFIKYRVAILLLCLPVFFHGIVFANATALHNHYLVKYTVPLALGLALCASILNKGARSRVALWLIFILTTVFSVHYFRTHYSTNDAPDFWISASNYIKENSAEDESLFLKMESPYYMPAVALTCFTGRNIALAENEAAAKSKAILLGKKRGVFYDLNEYSGEIQRVHFNGE